jgi:hypothetical protein
MQADHFDPKQTWEFLSDVVVTLAPVIEVRAACSFSITGTRGVFIFRSMLTDIRSPSAFLDQPEAGVKVTAARSDVQLLHKSCSHAILERKKSGHAGSAVRSLTTVQAIG